MGCIVDESDLEIIKGNNYPPAMWQFLVSEDPDVLFPLDGSVFKLTVTWAPSGTIVKASDVDPELVIDFEQSVLTWNYTAAQARALPLGRIARYELERWIGTTQQSLISGRISVSKGANPD